MKPGDFGIIAALLLSLAAPTAATTAIKSDSAAVPISGTGVSLPDSANRPGVVTTSLDSASQLPKGVSPKTPVDSASLLRRSGKPPIDSASAQRRMFGAPGAPMIPPVDSFNPDHGIIAGFGVGFFLGSSPVYSIWQNNLATQLTGLKISDSSFRMQGDSASLGFTVRKSPDIYNILIPVSAYFGYLTPKDRLTAGIAFGWQSKDYDARVTKPNEADSVTRYLEIRQGLNFYSLTFNLTYGRRIPEQFFSIDNIDRTDMIIGLTASPYIGLVRSGSIGISNPDARMNALRDSIVSQLESFTSSGLAYGWQIGIATLHHSSGHSGLAAEITYSGMWNMNFRYGSRALNNQDLGQQGSVSPLTYYSSRLGVTISFFRKMKTQGRNTGK